MRVMDQDVVVFDPKPLGPLLAVSPPARLGLGQPAELVPLSPLLRLLLLNSLLRKSSDSCVSEGTSSPRLRMEGEAGQTSVSESSLSVAWPWAL